MPDRRKLEVMAVVPARGGSKGIPRKNARDLHGKPLMAWSVEVALATRNIDRVIVSTDDPNLAAMAEDHGAQVPFLRPPNLAGDEAIISETLLDLRNRLYRDEGYVADVQVVLYPTHPFRKLSMVEKLVDLLLEGYETVNTVRRVTPPPGGFLVEDDNRLLPLTDHGLPPEGMTYHRSYGSFLGRLFDVTAARHYAHVIENPVELIDIDEWNDLYLAREVLRQGLYDFEL